VLSQLYLIKKRRIEGVVGQKSETDKEKLMIMITDVWDDHPGTQNQPEKRALLLRSSL
jgi:hypothetical protein